MQSLQVKLVKLKWFCTKIIGPSHAVVELSSCYLAREVWEEAPAKSSFVECSSKTEGQCSQPKVDFVTG